MKIRYFDKHGEEIKAGMKIRIGDDDPEEVFASSWPNGDEDLGVNATNPEWAKRCPDLVQELYPLSQFSRADIEIVK